MPGWFRILPACALLALAVTAPAQAQNNVVRLVVGAPPGGTTDTVARSIAAHMGPELGQTVVVENRAGAGGNIAADYVAKSNPDGNTLLVSFNSFSINASLYRSLPFDPIKDFTPISMLASVPSVLVVRQDFPAKTMQEFVDVVRKEPGKYTMALGGIGSSLHMAGERMKMMAGLDILNVPYKGTAPALTDLLGGQVDMMFGSALNVMPHLKKGGMRPLGVSSREPLEQFAGVPPIARTIPGFESNAWFAMFGPAGIPPERVTALNAAVRKAAASEKFRTMLEVDAASAVTTTPEELGKFVKEDIARYAEVVKFTGATVD